MENCLFCKIIRGEVPAEVVRETDDVLIIRDIRPQAPVHLLVIPREHVSSAAGVDDPRLWGQVMGEAVETARVLGLEERGFRLVVNTGDQAGQTIPHLHVHLLAGREFRWPPG